VRSKAETVSLIYRMYDKPKTKK